MPSNVTASKLTRREYDIMYILWQSDTSLVASEIARRGEDLTINTVQAVLKKLLNKKLIKIDEIVYSGTVLTRSYAPTVSADEFEMDFLLTSFLKLADKPMMTSNFIAALLEQEKDSDKLQHELDYLEKLLQEKRAQLKNETS